MLEFLSESSDEICGMLARMIPRAPVWPPTPDWDPLANEIPENADITGAPCMTGTVDCFTRVLTWWRSIEKSYLTNSLLAYK